jgi:hypothetical protein
MLIERKEDIAFRKGLGWIVADVWERCAIETVDVKLGSKVLIEEEGTSSSWE